MKKKRLAVCDKDPLYASNLADYINRTTNMPCEAEAFTSMESYEKYASCAKMDILLVDKELFETWMDAGKQNAEQEMQEQQEHQAQQKMQAQQEQQENAASQGLQSEQWMDDCEVIFLADEVSDVYHENAAEMAHGNARRHRRVNKFQAADRLLDDIRVICMQADEQEHEGMSRSSAGISSGLSSGVSFGASSGASCGSDFRYPSGSSSGASSGYPSGVSSGALSGYPSGSSSGLASQVGSMSGGEQGFRGAAGRSAYGNAREERNEQIIGNIRLVAVYSPVGRCGKTLFSIALGEVLSKNEKVLYLNMESYTAFDEETRNMAEGDISDLIYELRKGETDLTGQLRSMVCSFRSLDYLPPVRTLVDLKEIRCGEWLRLIGAAGRAGYETVILDAGCQTGDIFEMLSYCAEIYVPYLKDPVSVAKMNQFRENLTLCGRRELERKMKFLVLPQLSEDELRDYPMWAVRGKMGAYARRIQTDPDGADRP